MLAHESITVAHQKVTTRAPAAVATKCADAAAATNCGTSKDQNKKCAVSPSDLEMCIRTDATGDESGWPLLETSPLYPLIGGENEYIGGNVLEAIGSGMMEERFDPLQMAFSTPMAASVAGSLAIPLLCLPDRGGRRADFFVGLPPSGKKMGIRNDANERKSGSLAAGAQTLVDFVAELKSLVQSEVDTLEETMTGMRSKD